MPYCLILHNIATVNGCFLSPFAAVLSSCSCRCSSRCSLQAAPFLLPQLLPPQGLPVPFGLHPSSLSPAGMDVIPGGMWPRGFCRTWACDSGEALMVNAKQEKANLTSPGSTGREELGGCGLFSVPGWPASLSDEK